MATYYGLIIPKIYNGGTYLQSMIQTQTSQVSEGINEITATMTNGHTEKYYVKNGARGEQGDAGATTETAGLFGFHIDTSNGNLYLSYAGDTAPDIEINNDGELIYTY